MRTYFTYLKVLVDNEIIGCRFRTGSSHFLRVKGRDEVGIKARNHCGLDIYACEVNIDDW